MFLISTPTQQSFSSASVCTALAVLHHEAKRLKRLVWYTVQTQMHSLQTLTKQLHNERRI